jgi:hypothetical protein
MGPGLKLKEIEMTKKKGRGSERRKSEHQRVRTLKVFLEQS